MNRKGIFFTAMAIVLLTLFLLSYTFYSVVQQRQSIQKRVESLNSFVFSVEKDMERKLYISGFRMTFILIEDVIKRQKYVGQGVQGYVDLNGTYNELFFDEKFYGNDFSEEVFQIMEGADFNGIKDSIQDFGSQVNLNINLEDSSLNVFQEDPFRVKFVLTTNLTITDSSGLASWKTRRDFVAYVPVDRFEDPVYFINTGGFPVKIKFGNFTDINSHAVSGNYVASSSAPSFFQRLEGKINLVDENGIESFVDLTNPNFQNIYPSASVVDHEYFRNIQGNSVSGASGWIKLSPSKCVFYNVSC